MSAASMSDPYATLCVHQQGGTMDEMWQAEMWVEAQDRWYDEEDLWTDPTEWPDEDFNPWA